MYKENELAKIDPSSDFIKFIIERMNSKSGYRGLHIIQHSRTTVNQYCDILRCIYKIKKEKWLRVPRGDEYNYKKKRGFKLEEYPEYASLCNIVSSLKYTSKSSPMALKKITFVDLERFGLISRKTIKNNGQEVLCQPFKKCLVDKIKISKEGIMLIEEKNLKMQEQFSRIFKKTFPNLIKNLIILFIKHKINEISIIEYTLIFSWVDFEKNDFSIEKCAEILKSYKKLSKNSKNSVEYFFVNNAKPKHSKKNKLLYWDWGNWKNETQTIFGILNDSNLFFYKEEKKLLYLNNSFDEKTKKEWHKRSIKVIEEYGYKNNITKMQKPKESGFEHHHIIPISWIDSPREYKLIDNEKNILLISGTKHNQISKFNNIVKLSSKENSLFISSDDKEIELKIGIDVYVETKFLKEKIDYNKYLLKNLK